MKKFILLICLLSTSFSKAGNLDSLLTIVDQEIKNKQYKEAIYHCDVLLKVKQLPEIYVLKARALVEGRKQFTTNDSVFTASINCLNKAIQLDPMWAVSYGQKGFTFIIFQQFDSAVAAYTECILRETDSANLFRALNDRGAARIFTHDIHGALADYEVAKKIKPDDLGIYLNLSTLYSNEKDYKNAEKTVMEGLKKHPGNPDLKNNYGWILLNNQKYKEAITVFNEALRFHPGDNSLLSNRGFCYTKLGEFEKAFKDLNESVQADPHNSYVYKNLAVYYFAKKDTAKACENLDLAKKYGFDATYGNEVEELRTKNCK
ncbi:MAG TPA: tetratricopeptide repeat protein [Flavobacteriales bacterium]|nr:tetratricopeptide repeat protein [Flavobacteriales bacterium]